MKPLSPPLRMTEVAELLGWVTPASSKRELRTAAQRAVRMLRRIERDRGCRLLFCQKKTRAGGMPLYTTVAHLQRHCGELVDYKTFIERQVAERADKSLERLRVLEATLKLMGARIRKLEAEIKQLRLR